MQAVPPPDFETARWFAQEVQPHEPVLRSYLRKKFPSLPDVDDVVQESYLRLLRARVDGTLRSARGFLFTAARNAALDVFRRRRSAAPHVLVEEEDEAMADDLPIASEVVSRSQELELLSQAIEALPLRCRQVLKLRKIHGLSHREIADRLGISERTVNVQVGLGVRRCAAFLEERGVLARLPTSSTADMP